MRISASVALLVLAGAVFAASGAAAAGQEDYPTFFTKFGFSSSKDKFKGKIDSQKGSCVKGRKIRLYRKKSGDRKKVGADKANGKGKFSIGAGRGRPKDGAYFAKAEKSSFRSGSGDRVTCRPESSARVRIG